MGKLLCDWNECKELDKKAMKALVGSKSYTVLVADGGVLYLEVINACEDTINAVRKVLAEGLVEGDEYEYVEDRQAFILAKFKRFFRPFDTDSLLYAWEQDKNAFVLTESVVRCYGIGFDTVTRFLQDNPSFAMQYDGEDIVIRRILNGD